ncbi:MAG: hypothetical protein ACI9FN_003609 [Saprospiraceae bacterium]|jgi:hypothetical protein
MRYYTRYKICAVMCVLMAIYYCSCVDVIDLRAEEAEDIFIIDGFVYSDGRDPIVNIRRSAAFVSGPEGAQMPVSGAQIEIMEVGGPTIELIEVEAGVYSTVQPLGTVGTEYVLKVDVDGDSYESLLERMPPTVPIAALDWTTKELFVDNIAGNVEIQKRVVVLAEVDLSKFEEEIFLRYRIDGVWEFREAFAGGNPLNLNPISCYITEQVDLNNVALLDGRIVSNGALIQQSIIEEHINFRFAYNFCFTVTQESISNTAFNFWNSVQSEFERTGDIFEAPPARIKGNVFNTNDTNNNVIGLFSAISSSTSNITISGLSFTPAPIGQCVIFSNRPESCFRCETINNASTIKPDCL